MQTAQSLTLTLIQAAVAAAVVDAATHDGHQALAVALALSLFLAIARRTHSRLWTLAAAPAPKAARRAPPSPAPFEGVPQ